MAPNLYPHLALVSSSRLAEDRPKSSFTEELSLPSLVDLPRNSQREERAKPCWESLAVGGWASEGGPKTGKTRGMPPRTGFVPSKTVFSESQRRSRPEADFQERTVAPWRRTETDSPVGRVAVTRVFEWLMLTVAWGGRPGVVARAAGLLGRSTIFAGRWAVVYGGMCFRAL